MCNPFPRCGSILPGGVPRRSCCAGRPDDPCDPRAPPPVQSLCPLEGGTGCPLEVPRPLLGRFDDPLERRPLPVRMVCEIHRRACELCVRGHVSAKSHRLFGSRPQMVPASPDTYIVEMI